MFSIEACPIPEGALLNMYRNRAPAEGVEAHTDCFSVHINKSVELADFVFEFYTTPVFKLERVILKYLAARPSTDYQARQLADGCIDSFAAWNVEQRAEEQLLMCDFRGRTRSWFMVTPITTSDQPKTLLLFGSAVVPRKNRKTGKLELGDGFNILLGFHKLYSKILLHSAKMRLEKRLA